MQGEYKKESRLLLLAVEAGAVKAINETDDVALCIKQQTRILHEDFFIDEDSAENIVKVLCIVLDKKAPFAAKAVNEKMPKQKAMWMNDNLRKKLIAVKQRWEAELKVGVAYNTSRLTEFELKEFGGNNPWIYPSDHCYNKTNKGNLSNIRPMDEHNFSTPDNVPLFEYISRGRFIYLGENYPYNGVCELAGDGSIYGVWKNGIFCKK